ncbi:MAG: hypothetical protein HQL48_09435 [Gammaproteobacteria bacterium]|nr:hypothetical protein [Gammaproteobacteria bacterium]
MKQNILLLALLLFGMSNGWGKSLDIDAYDTALRVNYNSQSLKSMQGLSGELGLLFSEEDLDTYHVGFMVQGDNWSKSGVFNIGIGGRFYISNPGPYSLYALGFGGKIRFSPAKRIGVGGYLYHAPDITSTGDADRLTEAGMRIDYQVIPQAFVYVGYRHIESRIESGPYLELDSHAHLGFRMLF